MEVRHLRAFVAVAEELHFGRAADRLRLSPSPVSRTVAELEHETGAPLFTRRHHQVRLTATGTTLLPAARALLDSWTAFVDRGRALGRDAATPRIKIGSPSLAPTTVVDHVVAVLAGLRPDVPVDVEFAASVPLLAALQRGELDLTVVHLPLDEPDLRVLPLARYRLGIVVPDDDALARHAELGVEDLAGRRVLMVNPAVQPATMNRMSRWLAGAGAIVEELPDPDPIRVAQLVLHGRGVTLSGTAGPTAQIFAQPGLTTVPLRDTGPGIELGLVWRSDIDTAPWVRALAQRLADTVGEGPSL